jgi:hypothetical protein
MEISLLLALAIEHHLHNHSQAKAREQKGEIHWADETGLRSDDVRRRSYAPAGQTPEIQEAGMADRVLGRNQAHIQTPYGMVFTPAAVPIKHTCAF